MNNTNNQSARMSYDISKGVLYDSWIADFMQANPGNPGKAAKLCRDWVESRKLSQGEIRVETTLVTGNSQFTFAITPVQSNSANVIFPTEQRLPQQDSLISNMFKLEIAQTTGNTDTTYVRRTYPNTQDFAAADVAALNGSLYSNGYFTTKVNNDVIIPYRQIQNFLYAGQTQQTAPLGAASPQDQKRGSEDGYITNEANIWLIGSKNYVPQIILTGPITLTTPNIRVILTYAGVYAQNSTSIN